MAIGAFTDKASPPDGIAVATALGTCGDLWHDAVALLEDGLGAKSELRFYGRNYGWAVRYRCRGKALASLYPGEGRFTAQIVLPRSVEGSVRGRLRPGTRARLDTATPYQEGRWLYLPVAHDEDLVELELLLRAKLALR